jgi:enoyl-CoA hydratase/carnithine racemase
MTAMDGLVRGHVEGLRTEVRGAVLEITIARPERRNALTPALIRGLMDLLDRTQSHNGLRAVLLTGAGQKAFCAGFDIAMIDSPGAEVVGAERDLVEDLASAVVALPLPVVAAINGAAVGAGCDLAVACDIRIGTSACRFGMPPARLGILYGWKGVDRLVRSIGLPAAKELLLTGQLIDADRAYDLGLVSAVVPAGALLDEARAVTDTLAGNAPLSVAASKRMTDLLSAGAALSDDALSELASIQQRVWTSDDAVEGARAYRERRPPQFTGT